MTNVRGRLWLALGFITSCNVVFTTTAVKAQTTNSWISMGAGNWHSTVNWSAGRIPTNTDSVFFTNALTKIAIISSATTGTTSMVISNLTVAAPAGATNTVTFTTAGTNVPL